MQTLGLFITGTDTDVGKTYVTALIARDLTDAGVVVGVYKPVCSGSIPAPNGQPVWPDVEALAHSVDNRWPVERICPQRLSAPLAPPVAARQEGKEVDGRLLREGVRWWDRRVELLLVEGVGGLLCPLTESETVADLACDVGFPLLVVARRELGAINHTLLTLEAARHRGLTVAGIIVNETELVKHDDIAAETNPAEIVQRTETPLLSIVQYQQRSKLLDVERGECIDWLELARQ